MEIRKTTKLDGKKVVLLSRMGVEISEDKYEDFLQNLDKNGTVDVGLQDSSGINYKITLFKEIIIGEI